MDDTSGQLKLEGLGYIGFNFSLSFHRGSTNFGEEETPINSQYGRGEPI